MKKFNKGDLVRLRRDIWKKEITRAVVLRIIRGPDVAYGDSARVCFMDGTKSKVLLSDLEKLNDN